MDNLNLNSDEKIIQTTQTIIIDGVRHEVVLTDLRIILVKSETGEIHETIPYTDVILAIPGANKLREPVITISFNSPEGEKRTLDLIFIRHKDSQNLKEIERCLVLLKQHNVPVEGKNPGTDEVHRDQDRKENNGVPVVSEKISRPAVPEWSFTSTLHMVKKSSKEEGPERSPLVLIIAVVLIIAMVAGGVFVAGHVMKTKNAPVNQSTIVAEITTTSVPSPALTPAPEYQAASGTESSAPPVTVPTNGIWAKISYPGNFTGYIGAKGRLIEVNSSGTRFYQLPVNDAMIEGSIEKQDGSSDKIEVGIYNGGVLVSAIETRKPWGLIDIHIPVGPATGGMVIPTPVPEIQVSPYASLPPAKIPPTGVWVRVFYPGNYIGSISANGQMMAVNSTGDQFYQLSLANGLIDGSIEKQDGSVKNLIIEVYKDGALISRSYTSTPQGLVEMHTKV